MFFPPNFIWFPLKLMMGSYMKVDTLYKIMMWAVALVITNWSVLHGSDDCLQLYAQVCLQSKKKSPLKRITSMQVIFLICFASWHMWCACSQNFCIMCWIIYKLMISFLQFSPGDSTKMMVTSADSQVRILHRIDTICQFRG